MSKIHINLGIALMAVVVGCKSPTGGETVIESVLPSSSPEAGAAHSCGIKEDGTLWCWGKNDAGQLGTGVAAASGAVNTVGSWRAVATGGSAPIPPE